MTDDADDLANAAILLRDTTDKAIVVVEADLDLKLLEGVLEPGVRFVPTDGKPLALAVMEILNVDARDEGFLAIVDNDYDSLLGQELPDQVISFDHHSLEVMAACSTALDRLAQSTLSANKLRAAIENHDGSLVDLLLDRVARLGALRLVSHRLQLGLDFDGIDLRRYTDRKTLEIDLGGVARALLQQRFGSMARLQEVVQAVEGVMSEGHNYRDLAQGHDLVNVLAYGHHSMLATYGNDCPPGRYVGGSLIAAYRSSDFEKTQLAARLEEWERENGRRVLRAPVESDASSPG